MHGLLWPHRSQYLTVIILSINVASRIKRAFSISLGNHYVNHGKPAQLFVSVSVASGTGSVVKSADFISSNYMGSK